MSDQGEPKVMSEDELFRRFLEESDEMLAIVEGHSKTLETEPDNMEHVHGIFRAVHSLKSNSSFYNFTNVKTFCHTMESFLDLIREHKIEVNDEIVMTILEGADYLKEMFHNTVSHRQKPATDDELGLAGPEAEYLRKLGEFSKSDDIEESIGALRDELVKYFVKQKAGNGFEEDSPIGEIYELINRHAPYLVEDRRQGAQECEKNLFHGEIDVTREFHCLKRIGQGALEGKPLEDSNLAFARSVDSLIGKYSESGETDILESLATLKVDFEMMFQEEIGVDEFLAETILAFLDEYSKSLSERDKKPKDHGRPGAGAVRGAGPEEAAGKRTGYTRVDEGLLDVFMDHVGELITLNEQFNYLQQKLEQNELKDLASNFKNTNQSFRELSGMLQQSLYEIRKTPLEGALSKLPRLVRNIARESGKNIRLISTGGETEIDKNLLQKIETILIHLVRNSADHGVEKPGKRIELGKDPEGLIRIDVSSDQTNLSVEVSDNGRGIDMENVREVAVSKGLIGSEAVSKLNDKELLELILKPGFSTAAKVTETSGRGVGMDVLASSVRELGGEVLLKNYPGKGLTVSFSTPMAYTTRIKFGLTLAVGSSTYLIPAENVLESFKAQKEDVNTVEGKGEIVMRWGNIYPVIRLHRLFGQPPKHENIWDAILVLVESRQKTVCLMVDNVVGQRQIVYKQLTVRTREPCVFEGVSILDGTRIALILNVDGIIDQFNSVDAQESK